MLVLELILRWGPVAVVTLLVLAATLTFLRWLWLEVVKFVG